MHVRLLSFIPFLTFNALRNVQYSFAFTSSSSSLSINLHKHINLAQRRHHYNTNASFQKWNGKNVLSMSDGDESEAALDKYLSNGNLKKSNDYLRKNPETSMDKSRFISIFQSIEKRTRDAEEILLEEQRLQQTLTQGEIAIEYPTTSPARSEMTDVYYTLKHLKHLKLFGAAGNGNYPAAGSKTISQPVLEKVTELSMSSLTPKPTNTLLIAGIVAALLEGIISLVTGINYNVFVFGTILLAIVDNVVINGALFESAQRLLMPEYTKKVCRHEAGHFLIAYLLGCPVEGCVLNTWQALSDSRFGGRRTGVSAGTSFFDEELSNQINGKMPLSRSTIDRYTAIVMSGIAAEAINYGGADGGASDEMALIRFLSEISPRGGGAMAWNAEKIRSQARWGAMQAVLLLKHYRSSYEALVEVLESGGDLGECIWAIEQAAMNDESTTILNEPQGVIVEKGLIGEWVQDSDIIKEAVFAQQIRQNSGSRLDSTTSQISSVNRVPNVKEENMSLEESEEFLKSSYQEMEEKLREINSKLDALNDE